MPDKIGIICESYKLDKFKEELDNLKVSYKVVSNKNGLVTIVCDSYQFIIGQITNEVTQYFIDLAKQRKNN